MAIAEQQKIKQKLTGICPASANIMIAITTLGTASHMAKPRAQGGAESNPRVEHTAK